MKFPRRKARARPLPWGSPGRLMVTAPSISILAVLFVALIIGVDRLHREHKFALREALTMRGKPGQPSLGIAVMRIATLRLARQAGGAAIERGLLLDRRQRRFKVQLELAVVDAVAHDAQIARDRAGLIEKLVDLAGTDDLDRALGRGEVDALLLGLGEGRAKRAALRAVLVLCGANPRQVDGDD